MNAFGIFLAALAILASVTLHEAGHMGSAKAFGMKVTRFFVGFGPTIWSKVKGETEWGVKGLPLGGFVKITGMTPQDEDADDKKAMWRYPVWKRTIVMAAGSVVHFAIAFAIFWGVAATAALPNPDNPGPFAPVAEQVVKPAYITVGECVSAEWRKPCTGTAGPANVAGLQTGDLVKQVGDRQIANYGDLVTAIRTLPAGQPVKVVYERDGQAYSNTMTPVAAKRPPIDNDDGPLSDVSVIGVSIDYDPALPVTVQYNAGEAVPVAVTFMGRTFTGVIEAIKKFPEKIPGLWSAITGGERDPESPVSVVGASRIGGELVELRQWPSWFLLIATLNLFIGLFNLLPLLPLDGGHIAIAWFEKARSWVYARLRKPDPGRVDYYKLMPLTYTVILIFGAFTLLTVTADIVNPISILR